ncbi:methionine ABC transporter ATP-binding protein [Caenispirillum salinarum]|uniref:methionine ABC transporter ATP-binding protein n=1 Tax=Caenispirillum salinarum TaxID=859058 RepID=UPI0005BD14EE|nr:methionine ABC transporter ATP-binding protein [Caenispirillum salinarum]
MIRLEGIRKTFRARSGPATVLDDISLSVRQGEIFGIIGRSGAGKSTLVRCMNMLERPTAGRVVVAGQDMTALSEKALRGARHQIGMVFQHFNLLSARTVYDNVALPLEIAGRDPAHIRETVGPLLEMVGLGDKAGQYPAQLSGGQKQRVGIARALANDPAVLLCDEATSALDPETTQSILALLKDINARLGLTIVLITHEMAVVKEIADRVVVLDQGRVVEEGSVFDVFTAPASAVARSFVGDLLNHDLPAPVAARLVEAPAVDEDGVPVAEGANPLLRITFTGPAANRPILGELMAEGLLANILHGSIDYIQGKPFGVLTVEVLNGAAAMADALEYLHAIGLKGEIIGHVTADHRAAA